MLTAHLKRKTSPSWLMLRSCPIKAVKSALMIRPSSPLTPTLSPRWDKPPHSTPWPPTSRACHTTQTAPHTLTPPWTQTQPWITSHRTNQEIWVKMMRIEKSFQKWLVSFLLTMDFSWSHWSLEGSWLWMQSNSIALTLFKTIHVCLKPKLFTEIRLINNREWTQ